MAAQVCTPSSLIDAGAQIAPVMNQKQGKAMLIYVLSKWLAALGGTNYTTDFSTLITAAATWPDMNPAQEAAALIEIIRSVAVDDGASIPSDVNSLVAASNYLAHAPNQDSLLLFLACAIGRRM